MKKGFRLPQTKINGYLDEIKMLKEIVDRYPRVEWLATVKQEVSKVSQCEISNICYI